MPRAQSSLFFLNYNPINNPKPQIMSTIHFINYATEFVMPDQLRHLAHTCKIARDTVLLKCREVPRIPNSKYANQTTVVRMLRYSSLTGLMYDMRARTSFLQFIWVFPKFAFGFACHNDDLELVKYIDNMQLVHNIHCSYRPWDMIANAIPHVHTKTAREFLYGNIYNCTHSYRVLAHICKGAFNNIVPYNLHDFVIFQQILSRIIVFAIHSENIQLVEHIVSKYDIVPSYLHEEMNEHLAYKCAHLSRDTVEYLRAYKWFATWYDAREKYDLVDVMQDISNKRHLQLYKNEQRYGDIFALAITMGHGDIACNLITTGICPKYSRGYEYALIMNPFLTIDSAAYNLFEQRNIFKSPTNTLFMSRQVLTSIFPNRTIPVKQPTVFHLFDCIEMYHDVGGVRDVFQSLDKIRITPSDTINISWFIRTIGNIRRSFQIVSPAMPSRIEYAREKLMCTREQVQPGSKKETKIRGARFIIGILCADPNIMRKSQYVAHIIASTFNHFSNVYQLIAFVMSRRYARIYDGAASVRKFLGQSSIFRNRTNVLIKISSVNAIADVIRGMSLADIVQVLEYICAHTHNHARDREYKMETYVMIEFVARVIMRNLLARSQCSQIVMQ